MKQMKMQTFEQKWNKTPTKICSLKKLLATHASPTIYNFFKIEIKIIADKNTWIESGSGVGKKCTGSLDLDQKDQLRKIDLIQYFFSWIWIKSSWYNFFFLDFDQVVLIQYFLSWIWIKSSWYNFFFLDFDQVGLIQYFLFWFWIKSSWSNFFFLNFAQVELIQYFLYWIWIKSSWSNFTFLDFNQIELIQYLYI